MLVFQSYSGTPSPLRGTPSSRGRIYVCLFAYKKLLKDFLLLKTEAFKIYVS